MASMASSRRVVSSPFLVRVSRRTSGQRARYLWPIRGGYRRVAGKRHGSVAQLELEARCLFEDPNTTVHGPVVSGRAPQWEPEPLAHAEVTAGGGEGRADETTREHRQPGSEQRERARRLDPAFGELTRESNLGARPTKRSPTGHRFGAERTFSETYMLRIWC